MTAPFAQRESTYFLSCNRNKDSISLDLEAEPDTAVRSRKARPA